MVFFSLMAYPNPQQPTNLAAAQPGGAGIYRNGCDADIVIGECPDETQPGPECPPGPNGEDQVKTFNPRFGECQEIPCWYYNDKATSYRGVISTRESGIMVNGVCMPHFPPPPVDCEHVAPHSVAWEDCVWEGVRENAWRSLPYVGLGVCYWAVLVSEGGVSHEICAAIEVGIDLSHATDTGEGH